jgi:hypothetical protein
MRRREKNKFNVHGSVHRNKILVYKSQQDAYVTEFILSDNCSTCFGPSLSPNFRSTKQLLTTASGNRYTVLLSATIVQEMELI